MELRPPASHDMRPCQSSRSVRRVSRIDREHRPSLAKVGCDRAASQDKKTRDNDQINFTEKTPFC